jgi:hypothetical protein
VFGFHRTPCRQSRCEIVPTPDSSPTDKIIHDTLLRKGSKLSFCTIAKIIAQYYDIRTFGAEHYNLITYQNVNGIKYQH